MDTAAASTSPSRLLRQQSSALLRHLQHCRQAQGRWFEAALFVERAHGLIAPRFVTSVAVLIAGLVLACCWT